MPSTSPSSSIATVSFAKLPDNAVKFFGSKSEIEDMASSFFKLDIACDPTCKILVWKEGGEIHIGGINQPLRRYQPPQGVLVDYNGDKHSFEMPTSGRKIVIHTSQTPDNTAAIPLSPLLVPILDDILIYRELKAETIAPGDTEGQADNARKMSEVVKRISKRYEEEKAKAKAEADGTVAAKPKPTGTVPASRPKPKPKPPAAVPKPRPAASYSPPASSYSSYSG